MVVADGPRLTVHFEGDRIELDIPKKGVTVENGWRILPLSPPVVGC